jgi:SOS-response transcriptional repressor LexA
MRKPRSPSGSSAKPEWASTISELRGRLHQSQTAFGQRLSSSAMVVSRWERGAQEPTAGSYLELGNLAGDPLCWYFWGRAGLRNEDVMRVLPKLRDRLSRTAPVNIQLVSAGSGAKKSELPQLAAIPLLKLVAASHGDKGDGSAVLHDAPVESMIAAPKEWCPNLSTTTCLRVRGNSMAPLIYDGYILAVDSSQNDRAKLDGKIVIAWHKDMGLTVSRLKRYENTEVLQPENGGYESTVLDKKHTWKVLAKVLWWIGKAP